MTDARRTIYERRARFMLAAIAAMSVSGCDDKTKTKPEEPAADPQVCLKHNGTWKVRPSDAAPMPSTSAGPSAKGSG